MTRKHTHKHTHAVTSDAQLLSHYWGGREDARKLVRKSVVVFSFFLFPMLEHNHSNDTCKYRYIALWDCEGAHHGCIGRIVRTTRIFNS